MPNSDYATVEKFIRDDPEALTFWTQATRRGVGRPAQSERNEPESNVYNVHNIKPERPSGNSAEAVHRRLQRAVENGDQRAIGVQRQLHNREISAHRAAVNMGWK
ncbi:MAG: hypothetical protein KDH19_19980 [Geminicoccaceae bacterium]|nr:hypothetical protein [Geminicoccaceae bacterium]